MCNSSEAFTNPSFAVPANLPPPSNLPNANWGYRDNAATLRTLLWQQNKPYTLMPNKNPFAANLVKDVDTGGQSLIGYRSHLVDTAPIPCGNKSLKSVQRQVSSVPYASW